LPIGWKVLAPHARRGHMNRLHESRFFCYRFKVAPKVKVKVKSTLSV
jgi:hypothetical protein